MPLSEPDATADPLVVLVRQLLIAGSDDLPAAGVAAYVAGWTAALDLIERTDLTVAHADPALHSAVTELVRRVREAQRAALADEDGD